MIKTLQSKIDECVDSLLKNNHDMTIEQARGVIGSMTYTQLNDMHHDVVYCEHVDVVCTDDATGMMVLATKLRARQDLRDKMKDWDEEINPLA